MSTEQETDVKANGVASTEQEISVKADGDAIVGEKVKVADLPEDVEKTKTPLELAEILAATAISLSKRESMIPLILEKINDPNYPLAEVNRLIAIEIAGVAQEMGTLCRQAVLNCNYTETFVQKSYDQQIKALQALEKSLTNTDLQRHRDLLNFDGPKYQYAFGVNIGWVKLACQQALGRDNETMVQSIMKHYRDIVAMSEAELRRDVERIDSKGNQ